MKHQNRSKYELFLFHLFVSSFGFIVSLLSEPQKMRRRHTYNISKVAFDLNEELGPTAFLLGGEEELGVGLGCDLC